MLVRRISIACALAILPIVACGPIGSAGGNNGPSTTPAGGGSVVKLAGCAGAPMTKTAPNGYFTRGATVCTANGTPHLFHGVDRPSLEWAAHGDHISPYDFKLMAGWGANVVRIALDQDFWLSGAKLYDSGYPHFIDQVVGWAEEAGLDVILDLHWSDQGDLTAATTGQGNAVAQQTMADQNSLEFWKELAARYKGDGRILFELYNEPHDITPDVWLNGGSAGFDAVGMQQLYEAVRGAGADNLVIAGGLDWAYNLSEITPLTGYNVMYATHPYEQSNKQPQDWERDWGFLATSDVAPVIVTEFGDGQSCTPDWDTQLIQFADQHQASWTAWAWYVADCKFPSVISDWHGTPTVEGQVVHDALQGYPKPPPPMPDGGSMDGSVDGSVDGAPPADGAAPGDGGASTDGGTAVDGASEASVGDGSADAASD